MHVSHVMGAVRSSLRGDRKSLGQGATLTRREKVLRQTSECSHPCKERDGVGWGGAGAGGGGGVSPPLQQQQQTRTGALSQFVARQQPALHRRGAHRDSAPGVTWEERASFRVGVVAATRHGGAVDCVPTTPPYADQPLTYGWNSSLSRRKPTPNAPIGRLAYVRTGLNGK